MVISEYLNYLQEDSMEGNADLIANLSGAGTGTRLAVNLAVKAFQRLKTIFNKERNPQRKAQIQQKIQVAKQNIEKKKQQMRS